MSACLVSAVCVASVRREGWPGPDPARRMRPLLCLGRGRATSTPCCDFFSSAERARVVPSWATSPSRIFFISRSVIAASREMGQYSLTWTTHLICRLAASILLSSKAVPPGALMGTGRLGVVTVQSSPPSPSAGAPFSLANFPAIFLSCPTLVTATPASLDSPATISLRTRPPSLHPSPFVVTPICRGVLDDETGSTKRWVAVKEKSQNSGMSVTLIGIRRARHNLARWIARKHAMGAKGEVEVVSVTHTRDTGVSAR